MPVSQTASPQAGREVIGFSLLLMLLLLIAFGKAVLADTIDPDCFWHLRVAEQLQNDGVGRLVDHLSFASIKTPWTPYSWLGELSMKWLWDNTGLLGVVATQAILESGFLFLIAMCCFQRTEDSNPLMSVLVAVGFSAFLSLPYLSFRPVLIATVLLAVCALLLLRDRRLGESTRAVWAVPMLVALTINFHFYGLFVALWVGALTVGAWIEKRRAQSDLIDLHRRFKRYAILLGASAIACCCTPMLPGMLTAVMRLTASEPLTRSGVIAEMQPMYAGIVKQICLALVFAVILLAAWRRQLRIGEWIWLLGMAVIFVRVGRAGTIFVPIFAPVMCWSMPRLNDNLLSRRPVWIGAIVVLLIGTARIGWSMPATDQDVDAWANRHGPAMPGYPAEAANFVAQHVHRSTGHLINEFDWGGYLAWKLPDYQVLLDGRTPLYSAEFWNDLYLSDAPQPSKYLSGVEADAAIVPANKSRFKAALIGLGWKSAFRDDRAEVLVPPTAMARTTD